MEKITIEIEGNSDDLMEVDNLINLLSELKKTTKEKLVFEKIEAGSAIATANILDETQKKQLTNYFNFQPEPSIDNFKKYSPKADRDKNRGKRGGYRVITYFVTENNDVLLIEIYDKGEIENIPIEKIREKVRIALEDE
jgi:mRNA-degrading endonuclease RelE of RelBE toxin-antitoxin system